jgi:uncharacterized protein
VVVEATDGDIFDPAYLAVLKHVNDELILTPGVDRAWVKSLWTPAVRWTEVTEEGFQGGPVMRDNYNGSAQSVEQLKQNIARSGIGSLVAGNFKSSIIFVPLLDKEAGTGKPIDYRGLSKVLDEKIRDKYELAKNLDKIVATKETPKVRIHVIGFAKLIGELIDGLIKVMVLRSARSGISILRLVMDFGRRRKSSSSISPSDGQIGNPRFACARDRTNTRRLAIYSSSHRKYPDFASAQPI